MTLASTVAPLVAYAIVFQTLLYVVLPTRLRMRLAPLVTGVTGAALVVAAGLVFGFETIGLIGGDPGIAALAGMATVVVFSIAGLALLAHPRLRARLADPRLARLGRGEAMAHILFRIPVVTALTEELFFRGLLHAALVALYPTEPAILIGSVLFGLWHVGPGLDQSRAGSTGPEAGSALHAAITVLATTVAGVFLVWLRIETGSIWAPVAVHAATNMTMAAFARRASGDAATVATNSLPGWKRISEAFSFVWRER